MLGKCNEQDRCNSSLCIVSVIARRDKEAGNKQVTESDDWWACEVLGGLQTVMTVNKANTPREVVTRAAGGEGDPRNPWVAGSSCPIGPRSTPAAPGHLQHEPTPSPWGQSQLKASTHTFPTHSDTTKIPAEGRPLSRPGLTWLWAGCYGGSKASRLCSLPSRALNLLRAGHWAQRRMNRLSGCVHHQPVPSQVASQ